MKQIQCECGHLNPEGTILCEACGRALTEKAKQDKLHDMKYEGSARRSQTYNKTVIDKIWNFFSSVKVGVWLILITLIASALGTILPQEMYIPKTVPTEQYYNDVYGWFGGLYYTLGFHDLYGSWWYLLLIASIGISLVIASLDRFVPLYRSLKKQRVTRHESFMKRQRVYGSSEIADVDDAFNKVKEKLKVKRYTIKEENGNILAEKGRFSRWGPYVNHVGLIIFLIGGMLRFVPGMYVDKTLWIREGETLTIPGTDREYYLENKDFILETYDKEKDDEVFGEAIDRVGTIAKNFQSNVVLYKAQPSEVIGGEPELKKVQEKEIRVNEPLKFERFAVYQTTFKQDEFKTMSFALENKASGEKFGSITVDLNNPQERYDLENGYSIELLGYYPDFDGFDDKGEPQTKSPVPNNPAFLFRMNSPEKPDGEISFIGIQRNLEPLGENVYKMSFAGVEMRDVSGLTIRKDLTLWILAVGGFIFMVGVAQGAYWNHRRIWLQRNGKQVLVAAHTNKNWHGIKKEIKYIVEDTMIAEPEDQQQKDS